MLWFQTNVISFSKSPRALLTLPHSVCVSTAVFRFLLVETLSSSWVSAWRRGPPSVTWSRCWCSSSMSVRIRVRAVIFSDLGVISLHAASSVLPLSFPDREPAGDGDLQGDERESLPQNGVLRQGEWTSDRSGRAGVGFRWRTLG